MKRNKYLYLVVLQGHYGQGWEDLCAADDTLQGRREVRADLRAYRTNEGGRYRIVNRREVNPEWGGQG
jgi:hypothetical protein